MNNGQQVRVTSCRRTFADVLLCCCSLAHHAAPVVYWERRGQDITEFFFLPFSYIPSGNMNCRQWSAEGVWGIDDWNRSYKNNTSVITPVTFQNSHTTVYHVPYPRTDPDTSSEISEMIHCLWGHFASSHDGCEPSDVLHAVPIYNSSSHEIKFPLDPSLRSDKRNVRINKMSSYCLKHCRTFWEWGSHQGEKNIWRRSNNSHTFLTYT